MEFPEYFLQTCCLIFIQTQKMFQVLCYGKVSLTIRFYSKSIWKVFLKCLLIVAAMFAEIANIVMPAKNKAFEKNIPFATNCCRKKVKSLYSEMEHFLFIMLRNGACLLNAMLRNRTCFYPLPWKTERAMFVWIKHARESC